MLGADLGQLPLCPWSVEALGKLYMPSLGGEGGSPPSSSSVCEGGSSGSDTSSQPPRWRPSSCSLRCCWRPGASRQVGRTPHLIFYFRLYIYIESTWLNTSQLRSSLNLVSLLFGLAIYWQETNCVPHLKSFGFISCLFSHEKAFLFYIAGCILATLVFLFSDVRRRNSGWPFSKGRRTSVSRQVMRCRGRDGL